jgi:hypothetical protein
MGFAVVRLFVSQLLSQGSSFGLNIVGGIPFDHIVNSKW